MITKVGQCVSSDADYSTLVQRPVETKDTRGGLYTALARRVVGYYGPVITSFT
jgi:hypothetical protein